MRFRDPSEKCTVYIAKRKTTKNDRFQSQGQARARQTESSFNSNSELQYCAVDELTANAIDLKKIQKNK